MANLIKTVSFNFARRELLRHTARMAAIESVNFFKRSFVKGGFTDAAFEEWKPSLTPLAGFRTMTATSNLRNSIRTTEQSIRRIVVGSHLEYAEIHNNGGTITVTARMKRYFWWQYYRLAGQTRQSSAARAKLSAKAEFCRRMALMKEGSTVRIPQRQFLGESQTLMADLDSRLHAIIEDYWEKA